VSTQPAKGAGAPLADQFVCLSMLITGRHHTDYDTLSVMDVVAHNISREEMGGPYVGVGNK
jgi:hypothetical protein